MLIYDYKNRNVPLVVGDLIVEKVSNLRNKRIGEIVLIRGNKIKNCNIIKSFINNIRNKLYNNRNKIYIPLKN